ncbi:MAG TPA: hypothetical protein VHD83_20190 [Puia sp.]|nr:hypothetical protein [Puia sp.]
MSYWNYIVVCLSLSLLVILLWWEIRRVNKARRTGRIMATILLIAGLAAIALPITYNSTSATGSKEGVFLTEGYDPDSARIYLSSGVEVKDLQDLHVPALHVLGYGLTEEERAAISDVPVSFHPSSMRTGIGSLHWEKQLLSGQLFRIQGSIYNTTGGPVRLLLFGLGSLLDSTEVASKEEDFELRTVPAHTDLAVYRLAVVAGKDTLEQESIPVEVLPAKELKILVLAASPDFENRFLAGWLSEKGHGVVVRTAISKDKYDHAYLNTPATTVDHLSPSLLDKFDVVIADAAELRTMGASEHAVLWNAIAEKGLGLVIKGDSLSKPGERSMLRDSLNRILVSESMYGAGKILLTRLTATYTRLLAGERKEYAALWTRILRQAARKGEATEHWHFSPALPEVDHPVNVLLQTAASMPTGWLEEGDDETFVYVYLAQHPYLPFYWSGIYWPRTPGWHAAHTENGEYGWWYVWKKGDWAPIHRRERLEGTQRWIAARGERRAAATEGGGMRKLLVAKGWFYLLFVLSGLFLWVERRI